MGHCAKIGLNTLNFSESYLDVHVHMSTSEGPESMNGPHIFRGMGNSLGYKTNVVENTDGVEMTAGASSSQNPPSF